MKGIIPGREYWHDPEMRNKEGKTVCFYLWDNGIEVPDEQYKNP